MAFELPPLPYEPDALAPHISRETVDYHYGKHHQGYVANLNRLLGDTASDAESLEAVVMSSDGPVLNNAAQIWNHSFYWHSLRPGGGGAPAGLVDDAIGTAFGSYQRFRQDFAEAAAGLFGSGWVWLIDDSSSLSIMQTTNADLPMRHDVKALLTIDVWEHAYYLDYRNARAGYIETYLDSLLNWDHVAAQLTT